MLCFIDILVSLPHEKIPYVILNLFLSVFRVPKENFCLFGSMFLGHSQQKEKSYHFFLSCLKKKVHRCAKSLTLINVNTTLLLLFPSLFQTQQQQRSSLDSSQFYLLSIPYSNTNKQKKTRRPYTPELTNQNPNNCQNKGLD